MCSATTDTLSAAETCAAQRDFGRLECGPRGLFWLEFEPDSARNRVVRFENGRTTVMTPSPFSVRSRVHEYGGGAFCVAGDHLVFVNDADQQLWLQPLACGDAACRPLCLTDTLDTRYGDLLYDPFRQRVIAVAERHGENAVENCLVAVSLHSGCIETLARGHDFYSSPCLSPDGTQLAWLAWNHPDQPWVSTRLYCAPLDQDGVRLAPRLLAGGEGGESLFQPGFDAAGRLHVVSDRSGWWNLYRLEGSRWRNVCPLEAEFGVAQWQLGLSTWCAVSPERYVCGLIDGGRGRLLGIGSDGVTHDLTGDHTLFRALCSDGRVLYCVAEAPDRQVAVLRIDPQSGERRVLAGGERPRLPPSLPESLWFPVGNREEGERVQGFFYPPSTGRRQPPMLVMTHGGPTATTYPVYRAAVQYWTGRGFAVLDLNYRGSAGFGRAYRHRLAGNWGKTDVEDVAAAIDALGRAGRIDRQRVFIRGNSAGGYTTLGALASIDGLRAGASLYGVSDPLSLTSVTHKFESRYLDWLIGDPVGDTHRYRERSPLRRAADIRAPVIFFQGGQDRVVLPEQTLRMVEALRRQGLVTELHLFDDEGHGFRRCDNRIRVLEREFAFYRRFL